MTEIGDAPLVLMAAHGDKRGAARNERLKRLCADLQSRTPSAEWRWILISEPGELAQDLAAANGRRMLVAPLLFSDGFFYRDRLKPAVEDAVARGGDVELARPIGDWPELVELGAGLLRGFPLSGRKGVRALVIAHGSARSSNSADAARRFAARLSKRTGGEIEVAFLEEPPSPADAFERGPAFDAVIGLFFGAGLHGGEDFSAAVAAAPATPALALTLGEAPGFADVIERYVRRWLDGSGRD